MHVLKIGGNELDDAGFLPSLAQFVASLGEPVVIVHGGGKAIADRYRLVVQRKDSRWISLVQIPAARIYNLPTTRMYSLVCSPDGFSGSPSGGLGTVPRIVPPDGSSDSPSGGYQNLGRSLGQPFRRHTRTAPRAKRMILRPLYGVAHIRCHLSGRASLSRTSSHRNLDSLSALRNYFAGREREARQVYGMCMRASMMFGQPPHLLFIGKPRGSVPPQITKNPIH
jgi:hypothetical protein